MRYGRFREETICCWTRYQKSYLLHLEALFTKEGEKQKRMKKIAAKINFPPHFLQPFMELKMRIYLNIALLYFQFFFSFKMQSKNAVTILVPQNFKIQQIGKIDSYMQEVSILVVDSEVICLFKHAAGVFANVFKILKYFHSKRGRFHSPIASEELMLNSFLLSILLLTHLFFCGSRFKDYELGVITRCQALCHYCGDKNGLNRLAMEGSFQKKTPLLWYTIVVCCYRVSKTFFQVGEMDLNMFIFW